MLLVKKLLLIGALIMATSAAHSDCAIVQPSNKPAGLFTGPGYEFFKLSDLLNNEVLQIAGKEDGDWIYVYRLFDSHNGWVNSKYIRRESGCSLDLGYPKWLGIRDKSN